MTARSPLFTAWIDHDRATIRARGRLDHVSADLLRGTVETLQRDGHGAITLDLAQLADPDHDGVLSGVVEELTASGARIVVRRKPSWTAAPCRTAGCTPSAPQAWSRGVRSAWRR